jgi:hypothetical protein
MPKADWMVSNKENQILQRLKRFSEYLQWLLMLPDTLSEPWLMLADFLQYSMTSVVDDLKDQQETQDVMPRGHTFLNTLRSHAPNRVLTQRLPAIDDEDNQDNQDHDDEADTLAPDDAKEFQLVMPGDYKESASLTFASARFAMKRSVDFKRIPRSGTLMARLNGASDLPSNVGTFSVVTLHPMPGQPFVTRKRTAPQNSADPTWNMRMSFHVDTVATSVLLFTLMSRTRELGTVEVNVLEIAQLCTQGQGNKGAGKMVHRLTTLAVCPGLLDVEFEYREDQVSHNPANETSAKASPVLIKNPLSWLRLSWS